MRAHGSRLSKPHPTRNPATPLRDDEDSDHREQRMQEGGRRFRSAHVVEMEKQGVGKNHQNHSAQRASARRRRTRESRAGERAPAPGCAGDSQRERLPCTLFRTGCKNADLPPKLCRIRRRTCSPPVFSTASLFKDTSCASAGVPENSAPALHAGPAVNEKATPAIGRPLL